MCSLLQANEDHSIFVEENCHKESNTQTLSTLSTQCSENHLNQDWLTVTRQLIDFLFLSFSVSSSLSMYFVLLVFENYVFYRQIHKWTCCACGKVSTMHSYHIIPDLPTNNIRIHFIIAEDRHTVRYATCKYVIDTTNFNKNLIQFW